MENNKEHKGTELSNVNRTWDENERKLQAGEEATPTPSIEPATELDQVIKDEAIEYDKANKEDRLLSGDRATVIDEKDE